MDAWLISGPPRRSGCRIRATATRVDSSLDDTAGRHSGRHGGDLPANLSTHLRMINRTPELDAFEARWSAQTRATSSYANAVRWFDAALAHARAMGAPAAKPFVSHEEARRVLASDIRVADALHALDRIRTAERKTDALK